LPATLLPLSLASKRPLNFGCISIGDEVIFDMLDVGTLCLVERGVTSVQIKVQRGSHATGCFTRLLSAAQQQQGNRKFAPTVGWSPDRISMAATQ